jgi:hypothetical protein
MAKLVIRSTSVGKTVRGSGKRIQETRELEAFDRLEAHGPFEVEVVFGGAGPARLEGDDNLLPLAKTEVSRGLLTVHLAAESGGSLTVEAERPLTLHLPVESLQRVQTHASAQVRAAGTLRTSTLALEAHGSSAIDLAVECDELEQEVQGSATTKLRGRATRHHVRASGSARIHAFDLASEVCEVRSSGSAEVEVQASRQLQARTSGKSRVVHRGSAEPSRSSTGTSVVERG